jgi:hypothetical protein
MKSLNCVSHLHKNSHTNVSNFKNIFSGLYPRPSFQRGGVTEGGEGRNRRKEGMRRYRMRRRKGGIKEGWEGKKERGKEKGDGREGMGPLLYASLPSTQK